MRATIGIVVATAAIATGSGIAAAIVNGRKNVAASILAVIAGLAPWMFFIGWKAQSNVLTLVGMFASLPAFLLAILFQLFGEKTNNNQVLGAILIGGSMAGALSSVSVWDLLCQME